jgi:hypothetical protein
MRLNSRESERERSIKSYERRINELEHRLQTAERSQGKNGQLPASVQQMLDSAVAANNAKLQQLKKIHQRLLEQHTELEMKYYELEGERQAEQGRPRAEEKYTYRSPEKEGIARSYSFRKPSYDTKYESQYLPPISTEQSNDDYHYGEYHSPQSAHSPPSLTSATRPVRLESLHSKRSGAGSMPFGQSFSANYDASLDAHFQAANAPDTVVSSGKSAYSVDTNSSRGGGGGEKKEKVAPKSEVRIYGRGGAQNIGKKLKDEDKKREKEQKKQVQQKTGGFRGLKGIM